MRSRLTFTVASCLALVAAACNRGPQQHRGSGEHLRKIDFEGNQRLSDDTLRTGLALRRAQKRGRPPDPYLVQLDEDRVRGEYLRKGYLGVDVRSRVERDGDAATVIYTVEEGDRAKTRVVIRGLPDDPELPASKVRAQLPLDDGEPFDYAKYDEAKPFLLGVVQNAGYAHAKLNATVFADRANDTAVVNLDFDPGPKSKFGTVTVEGVDGPLADAVRGRVQFSVGEQYSTSAIVATQRALYAMQRFSTVQVQPDDDVDETVNVTVAVSEAARHELKLGGGFGIDPTAYETRARLGYSIAGWPTPMDTFTADFQPAYAYLRDGSGWQPRIRAMAKLERQDIFWTYSSGDVEGGYNYTAIEAYTSYGPRARVGFATPVFSDKLHLKVGWGIEQRDFREISPVLGPELAMRLGLDESQRNGAFQQGLTLDLRDNPVDTKLGLWGQVIAMEGTKYAGGEFDYLQLIPELRGYVPVGNVVLAARARAGTFFGEVPTTERFFSGGASRHRGFGERRLSPSVTGMVEEGEITVPYGGTSLVETSVEARIPITTWRKIGFGTVLFLDGGDVADDGQEIDTGNLHWAAGIGFRALTVVGPIRADLGYRLNRTGLMDPAPGSRFAFHFSIGEAF